MIIVIIHLACDSNRCSVDDGCDDDDVSITCSDRMYMMMLWFILPHLIICASFLILFSFIILYTYITEHNHNISSYDKLFILITMI